MNAGGVSKDYRMGDTLQVYYLPGIDTVVQAQNNPYKYYLFLGSTSILLFVGVFSFIRGLKGKGIWGN